MRKLRVRFTFTLLIMILVPPALLLAQVEDVVVVEAPADYMVYLLLAFNSGLIAMVVQLLKNKAMPWLKQNAPYTIPLIGMGIGMVTAAILAATGIDISPIGNVFEVGVISGAIASSGFAVAKEAQNKVRARRG